MLRQERSTIILLLGDINTQKDLDPIRDNEFPDGFVDYNHNGKEDEGEHVIVWLERGWMGSIYNAHATTNLDRDSWEEQIS